jgi:hypothetical protein
LSHPTNVYQLGCQCEETCAEVVATYTTIPIPRSRPVRRPKASVELTQTVAEHAMESLRLIAEGKALHPEVTALSLADILAAALEQAKAEDAR